MIPAEPSKLLSQRPRGEIRKLLARNGWAIAGASVATVVVELGAYFIGRTDGADSLAAVLAALSVAVVWVALAAPALAASGKGSADALLRGATVADASAVMLIILWLLSPHVTIVAAAKIYCTLAAVALAGTAAVCLGRSPAGRFALAVVAAGVLVAALGSPFWCGGLAQAAGPETGPTVIALAVYANPFYSITSAVAEAAGSVGFVWHRWNMMYEIVPDDFIAPPVPWYASMVIYGALAGVLAAGSLLRRR